MNSEARSPLRFSSFQIAASVSPQADPKVSPDVREIVRKIPNDGFVCRHDVRIHARVVVERESSESLKHVPPRWFSSFRGLPVFPLIPTTGFTEREGAQVEPGEVKAGGRHLGGLFAWGAFSPGAELGCRVGKGFNGRRHGAFQRPAQHPGSAAKAALNDCPHERKAKGAHLAAFVSCIPLLAGRFDDLCLRMPPLLHPANVDVKCSVPKSHPHPLDIVQGARSHSLRDRG